MRQTLFITLLIVTFFIGCGGSYGVTYDTEPSCAILICNGESKGYTSQFMVLKYDKDNIDENGILHTQRCKAVFSSGYEEEYSNRIDTNRFEDSVKMIITRPQGAGYSQDRNFMCSDTCIYSQAMQMWESIYTPTSFAWLSFKGYQPKSIDDMFLNIKRTFYNSGVCR